MRVFLKITVYLFILLAFFLLTAMPVYADTPLPDSPPTVEEVNIYRHLLETDDMLVVIYANIPYATPPGDTVDETFIWRLIDTDNTTELGSVVGYAFIDNGYGYNVISFYFSATDNLTWAQEYIIRLNGSPSAFDDPPEYNFSIAVADYCTETGQSGNRQALTTEIIDMAIDLNFKWGLIFDEFLLLEMETGTVLSMYGETFFRGAIYGLQGMAPALFSVAIRDVEYEAREWDPEYSENLTGQWAGTWVQSAIDAGKGLFSVDYDLVGMLITFSICVGVVIANAVVAQDVWGGLTDCSFVLVLCTRLGFLPMVMLGLIAAVCILYMGLRLWRPLG